MLMSVSFLEGWLYTANTITIMHRVIYLPLDNVKYILVEFLLQKHFKW